MAKFLIVFVFLSSFSANASLVRPLLQFGFDGGGDELQKGSDTSKFDIHSGTGLHLSTGLLYSISDTHPHSFEAQLSIGFKFDWDVEAEGDVSWDRYPIDFMYFYKNQREEFRLGYGVTYHIAPSLKGEKDRAEISRKYKDAFGYQIAIEKKTPTDAKLDFAIGFRYTFLKYKEKTTGASFRADALGLYMIFFWDLKS